MTSSYVEGLSVSGLGFAWSQPQPWERAVPFPPGPDMSSPQYHTPTMTAGVTDAAGGAGPPAAGEGGEAVTPWWKKRAAPLGAYGNYTPPGEGPQSQVKITEVEGGDEGYRGGGYEKPATHSMAAEDDTAAGDGKGLGQGGVGGRWGGGRGGWQPPPAPKPVLPEAVAAMRFVRPLAENGYSVSANGLSAAGGDVDAPGAGSGLSGEGKGNPAPEAGDEDGAGTEAGQGAGVGVGAVEVVEKIEDDVEGGEEVHG